MEAKGLSLVTGANGHLGNNLVRLLIGMNIPVRASVRNLQSAKRAMEGLHCEVVQADITSKASLVRAMQDVEVVYAVGASFKLWAKDPVREIYDVNLSGTRHLIEAAAEARVRKIVYVSSIAALNYTKTPISEASGYNSDRRDWYYNSKNDGEQLAFKLAKELGIELTAVLPSAMIGSEVTSDLSVSMNILKLILNREVPVETNIRINWIDVKDVAKGCYLAAQYGESGSRYILANEKSMSIRETTMLARELYPNQKINLPVSIPKPVLYVVGALMELAGKIAGKAPLLSRKEIVMFSGLLQDFDLTKSKTELGFSPTLPADALREAMHYLMNRAGQFGIRLSK